MCKLGVCNHPPLHPWGTGALKRRGRVQRSLDLLPKGLTCPSCKRHPSDRDLTETSWAPDQWLNPRTLLPVRDFTSNFPLSVPGPTHQVSLSGNNGNTDSLLPLDGTTERWGWQQAWPKYTVCSSPMHIPASQAQPFAGWHFTLGGHSALTSFLLNSHPAFPVPINASSIPTCSPCSPVGSHSAFLLTCFTTRSSFKPRYSCSGLTSWFHCLLVPKLGWKAADQGFHQLKLQLNVKQK